MRRRSLDAPYQATKQPYAYRGGIRESDLQGHKVWSEVVRSLHRSRFKLEDGRCTTMRGNGVRRSPTEVREGHIWVCVGAGVLVLLKCVDLGGTWAMLAISRSSFPGEYRAP